MRAAVQSNWSTGSGAGAGAGGEGLHLGVLRVHLPPHDGALPYAHPHRRPRAHLHRRPSWRHPRPHHIPCSKRPRPSISAYQPAKARPSLGFERLIVTWLGVTCLTKESSDEQFAQGDSYPGLEFAIFGLMGLGSGLLNLGLPETAGKPLPESVADVLHLARSSPASPERVPLVPCCILKHCLAGCRGGPRTARPPIDFWTRKRVDCPRLLFGSPLMRIRSVGYVNLRFQLRSSDLGCDHALSHSCLLSADSKSASSIQIGPQSEHGTREIPPKHFNFNNYAGRFVNSFRHVNYGKPLPWQ